jgi:predicted tellurium resistance membrane protein TerC
MPVFAMSATVALSTVGTVIVFGVVAAIAIIRANRSKSYQRWPKPFRWAWYALCGLLITLGSAILVNNYVDDWGVPAAAWFLLVPAAYGIYLALTAHSSPPESPRSDSTQR